MLKLINMFLSEYHLAHSPKSFAAGLLVVAVLLYGFSLNPGRQLNSPGKNDVSVIDSETIVLGAKTAQIELTEFVDYSCPRCQEFLPVRKALEEHFGKQLRVTIRHFPMEKTCNPGLKKTFHENSCIAASFAICAFKENAYSEAEERLLYGDIDKASLDFGSKILSPKTKTCMQSSEVNTRIQRDIQLGARIGITGTPLLLINDQVYSGDKNYETLKNAIDGVLKAVRTIPVVGLDAMVTAEE